MLYSSFRRPLGKDNHIPPLFLAPSLFPAPSFAELAAPWALCEAWRTAMLVELTAGVDRRKADRAVSIVTIAGEEEPVGSPRILGSNMVEGEVCVWFALSLCCPTLDVRSACSTFDFLPPPQFVLGTDAHVANNLTRLSTHVSAFSPRN